MAETHKEIVKVWIAPGCIVCDSCESDCPEVFDVQEETCIIRPEAMNAEFTRNLTPSIITAAEGCPVDVIKYDTIEVEGPDPWAGKEEVATAGAGAGGGGGAAKKAGWAPPQGPPDPKWSGLLKAANVTGRVAGAPVSTVRPAAKAPVEAVAASLDAHAPPDAMAATAIGAGYIRPAPTVTQRIREKASKAAATTRRGFNMALAVGWGAMIAAGGTFAAALQSFMAPKISREPPATFRAGKVSEFAQAGVYEQFKDKNVWLVHLADGKLVALSTICTHLGCIPNWLPNDSKYKCPCHGSGFYMDGVNFEGPAPRPLERHKIYMDGDIVMIDKSLKYREELGQWTSSDSFINV
ncbi:MAG: Rieske 2Fe-2S domain-containing protein [Phycisphaeraceae bacterium]